MEAANRRWSLALAATALLLAGTVKAAGPAQGAEALISDCKTVSCLRDLLRGPAGPAGPAGRSAVQDVYAGSYRMGRLLGLDVTIQCSATSRLPGTNIYGEESYNVGFPGAVETSTGHVVHLCIGVKFPPNDVGVSLAVIAFYPESFIKVFKTTDCSGPVYVYVAPPITGEIDFSGNIVGNQGEVRAAIGPVMGKPRVVSVVPSQINQPGGDKHRFFIAGTPERFVPAATTDSGPCRALAPSTTPASTYVSLIPNDPSVTGLPNDPVTPYTLVDVR